MNGRTIVDRLSPGMVEREPETIAAWIDAALAQARTEEREDACIATCDLCRQRIEINEYQGSGVYYHVGGQRCAASAIRHRARMTL